MTILLRRCLFICLALACSGIGLIELVQASDSGAYAKRPAPDMRVAQLRRGN